MSSLSKMLFQHTSLLGIKLWVLILIFIAIFLLILAILSVCIISYCRRRSYEPHFRLSKPGIPNNLHRTNYSASSLDRRLLPRSFFEVEMNVRKQENQAVASESSVTDLELAARYSPMGSDSSRGNRYTLGEILVATNGLAEENVIGNGDNGIVYRGILLNNLRVAVKRILNISCQAEEFIVGAEAIGHARHKNLATLLGYCMEGGYRMLVYEYIDNGNLHNWLHGYPGQASPLTWNMRMNIIQGTAKGLAYLHEDIEPKIVHRDVKSTNILLDRQWNPKITDFGFFKLSDPEWIEKRACAKGISGFAAPEYAYTDVLTEKSDIYCFGILIMEIVTGRTPMDQHIPEVYLVDWLKSMVANQEVVNVVDPKLPDIPTSKELKRIILIALRCVDPDVKNRPKMGDVIHMLEPRDLLLADRIGRETSPPHYPQEGQIAANSAEV